MTKDTQPAPMTDTNSNGLAIASLVLGILSLTGFFFFTGIPAIITGIMSLRKQQKEKGMSIAGIIMGSIGTLLSLLFALALILFIVLSFMNSPSSTQYDVPTPEFEFPMESSRT